MRYEVGAMIKICPRCQSTWAGGLWCEDCGATLDDPYADAAQSFPEKVWAYIRLQYGARRGMIVRVLAILLGPVVAGLLLRESIVLASPWNYVASLASIAAGLLAWWCIHWFAGKAVKIWVLRRGRVRKARLAKALLRKAVPRRR
jgi:hypothetical protein